jgi:hypothetical protein
MRTLAREQSFGLWDRYWEEMSQEWFKVELLQDYTGEDDGESLQAWKAGDKKRSEQLLSTSAGDAEWIKTCRAKVRQGVELIRLHAVEEPYTPYLAWELMAYRLKNIPACGEKVSLVPKQKIAGLDLPPGDLMIFDNKRVVINAYDDTGLMVRADFYDADGGDDISEFLLLKEELTKQAEPLSKS